MKKRPLVVMCLLFMAGIWLLDTAGISDLWNPRPDPAAKSFAGEGKSVIVHGEVYKYEIRKTSCLVYLKDAVLQKESQTYNLIHLRVTAPDGTHYMIGQKISAEGKLYEIESPGNPGQFDARTYYAMDSIFYTMDAEKLTALDNSCDIVRENISNIRYGMQSSLYGLLNENIADLYSAILLGDKAQMDSEVKTRFQMAGIIHILTISGMHISLLGIGIFELLKRLGAGNRAAGAIAVALLVFYGILVGGSAATVRALVMFMAAIGARCIGRTYDLFSAMSLAAMLLLTAHPGYLYSSSFLLSFGAVLGIGILQSYSSMNYTASGKPSLLRRLGQSAAAALCVCLSTLPLLLYFYYEVPTYGNLITLLLAPTLPVVLLSGFLGCLSGLLLPALGGLLIFPGGLLLAGYDEICRFVQWLPCPTIILGQPSVLRAAGYYAILAAGLLVVHHIHVGRRLTLCGAVAAALVTLLLPFGETELTLTNLDVGQGDGAVVETPSGGHYIIDGGSSTVKNAGTYRLIPYLKSQGIRRVSAAVLTHPDADHINAVQELLEAIDTRQTSLRLDRLLLPVWGRDSEEFSEILQLAGDNAIPVAYLQKGDVIRDGGVTFTVLHPDGEDYREEANAGSVTLRIRYGSFSGLFTGDLEGEGEQAVMSVLRDSTYLKVAHHGSKNSTGDAFLRAVDPQIAVISYGKGNRYGHPHEELLERLKETDCQIYTTVQCGAVRVATDGRQVKVTGFRRQINP